MSNGTQSDSSGFDWSDILRGAIGVLSAIGAGLAVYFGVKRATRTVDRINETRDEDNKMTTSQEISYYSSDVSNTCQKFGTVMSSAATLLGALDGIINPEKQQFNPQMAPNWYFGNGGGAFGYGYGQYYNNGNVANPLCWAMAAVNGGIGNNPYQPPPQQPNGYGPPQNNPYGQPYMNYFPDGSHTYTIPGPNGGTAVVTGDPFKP